MKKSLLKFLIIPLLFLSSSPRSVEIEHHPVVILGGGPGALTSAIYFGRFNVQPLVLEGELPGGAITQSQTVQNWPGELQISGSELMQKMRKQAQENGAIFKREEVVEVDFSKRPYTFTARSFANSEKKHIFTADAVILAMGTKPNFLGVEGERAYWGKGVTNCAVCDGPLFKDQTVAVVGGGDAAILEAEYLSKIAHKVYLFVRGTSFKTVEEKRKEQLLARSNVEVLFKTTIQKISGDNEKVTYVVLDSQGREKKIKLDAVFLAIGSTPNTELFQKHLKLDSKGYIVLEEGQRTPLAGVYAVGDISDPYYKQAISAAGDGAKAAIEAYYDVISNSSSGNQQREQSVLNEERTVQEIISVQQFDEQIRKSKIPIVVDFYASWCGPCQTLSPILGAKAQKLAKKFTFLKVNVDTFSEIAKRYSIKSMPTMLLLKSGKEIERKIGTHEISSFLEEKERALPAAEKQPY